MARGRAASATAVSGGTGATSGGDILSPVADHNLILVETRDRVTTVTLNRPDSFNALTGEMSDEVCRALAGARTDDRVGAVVITGAGRAFCSGQDLRSIEPEASDGDVGDFVRNHLRLHFNRLILDIRRLPKPVLGSINGVAAGAGMSLALACDLRVGSDQASFMQAFSRVGLVPDAGSTYLLAALVGTARALELAWTARRVGADEALALGLLNRKVAADELLRETHDFASTLAHGPALAIGMTKEAILESAGRGLAAALDHEAELQAQCIATDDFREGVAAFLEKREPRFGQSPARA